MPARVLFDDGKIINGQKKKTDLKEWLRRYGCGDEVTHGFGDDDGRGHVFRFHIGEQWAFNMLLRIWTSSSPSLMSCCFCSLSGGCKESSCESHAGGRPTP